MLRLLPPMLVWVFLIMSHTSSGQCPASTPLTIDTVLTTESRCQSSGAATAVISGGAAPFTYRITTGPVTPGPQSSNTFLSLPQGNYTVQVTDNCNTTINYTFVITGTYSVPQVTADLQSPSCPGGTNGSLKINVTQGRPPFTYALISPSPVVAAPQAGNTFTGLPGGDYTYRVTDSCGNFQTRTVSLVDGTIGVLQLGYFYFEYQACDSFSLPYTIYPTGIKPPYTAQLTLPDGSTQVHVINSTNASVQDTFHFRYKHIAYNYSKLITLTVTNSCGASKNFSLNFYYLDMDVRTSINGCNGQYSYTLDDLRDGKPNQSPYKLHCEPTTYTLVNAAGAAVAVQTNNSTFTGYPSGQQYSVIREDCCRKDTINFFWAIASPLKILYYSASPDPVCKEGTTNVRFSINKVQTGTIVIASGPPSVTFADGVVHTYTYPDTIRNMPFGSVGLTLQYFTPGTYVVYALNACGEKDSITMTLTPAQMRHTTFSAQLIKGCSGGNKIRWNTTSNTVMFTGNNPNAVDGEFFINNTSIKNIFSEPYNDSVVNLSSGTYYLNYTYREVNNERYFLKDMEQYQQTPDRFLDTLVIPPYTQPVFAPVAAVASCGANNAVALLPDSTRGVTPYAFEITTGSQATGVQASPVFPNLPVGSYQFRMSDACGNSYSSNIAADTLAVPQVSLSGVSCAGGSAVLTVASNPYYTYTWQRPGGASSTGNVLAINPVTIADTGIYTLTVTSKVNGCTDSRQRGISFGLCQLLPLSFLSFNGTVYGNEVRLYWKTTDEVNASHFVAERSADAKKFTAVQQVQATGKVSNTYTTTDREPLEDVSYYRIKAVDKDGQIRYTHTISVTCAMLPKPTVRPTLITYENVVVINYPKITHTAWVQLVSTDGHVLLTKTVKRGSMQTNIEVSKLAKGSYLVVFVNEGNRTAVQLVKQ